MRLITKYLTNYVFPLNCSLCSEFIDSNTGFCATCWNRLNFISKPYCQWCGRAFEISIFEDITCGKCLHEAPIFYKARSLIKFDQHSKKLIHAFKYHDKTELGKLFAKLLWNRYGDDINNIDIIVPVPMNRFKRLFRMYNHAQILGDKISRLAGKLLIPDLLIKSKWTKSQAFLSRKQRELNLSGSLKFNSKYFIKHQNILLIDDVMTTGETIKKCSMLLKRAGANEITVLTIATT